MCYMESRQSPRRPRLSTSPRVGVRELRQNLSVYLERVIAGERLEVTDHGHPVALLIPLPPAATLVERLVAEGRAIPATQNRDWLSTSPPVKVSAAFRRRLWAAYEETREDRV